MTDLSELLTRVKAATGPDRELSRDIWQALDTPEWGAAYLQAQEPCGCPHEQAVEYAARYLVDVTASVDAALTFSERVLSGHQINLSTYGPFAEASTGAKGVNAALRAPTAPLAIIAATLTALITQEQQS